MEDLINISELLQTIRRIALTPHRRNMQMKGGQSQSRWHGRGIQFAGVRHYMPGDETRFIDWNVTARYQQPFVKYFEEEKEVHILCGLDTSASMSTGSQYRKYVECIATIAYSAMMQQDACGISLFNHSIEKYIPPRSGQNHFMHLLGAMTNTTPKATGTQLDSFLRHCLNTLHRRHWIFLCSDFYALDEMTLLRQCAYQHEVIGILIQENMEQSIPNSGMWRMQDAETKAWFWVDAQDSKWRNQYIQRALEHEARVQNIFKKAGARLLILPQENYLESLMQHIQHRVQVK